MKCEFKEMDNYIPIEYNLSYKIDGTKMFVDLTNKLKNESYRSRFTWIYQNSSGFHAPFNHNYVFKLISYFNESGVKHAKPYTEVFKINHYESVILYKPKNLTVSNITIDSALISWKLNETNNNYASLPIDYDLSYRSEFAPNPTEWTSIPIESHSHKFNSILVENLVYPYAKYDIRLRVKSHQAPDTPEMWSEYIMNDFQTLPKIPDRPPESIFGAFHINDHKEVTLYWKELQQSESNGPHLRYEFTEIRQDEKM